MKKIISIILCLAMLLSASCFTFAASPSLNNFVAVNEYVEGQFTDVKSTDWFVGNVQRAYELGLVKGSSADKFNPGGEITLAETLALACRLNSIYETGKAEFTQGQPWYQVYVDYAIAKKIINAGNYSSYEKKATRADFAMILSHSIPDSEFKAINKIADGLIPDVDMTEVYSKEVYKLYNAGILTGSDKYGSFKPMSTIVRSEVATIVNRIAEVSARKQVVLADAPEFPDSISFGSDNYLSTMGKTSKISVNFTPANVINKTVIFSTSNPNIATVDADGVVSCKSVGTVTINATAGNGQTAKCTLKVQKPSLKELVAYPEPKYVGGSFFSPVIELNSVGGVKVEWTAKYLGNKNVNYYTVIMTLCDTFGKPVKDQITGSSTVLCKVVGPVAPGEDIQLWNVVGYNPVCAMVKIDSIILEFDDGTTLSGPYDFTVYDYRNKDKYTWNN